MNTPTAIFLAGALIAGGIYAASERADAQSDSEIGRWAVSAGAGDRAWLVDTTTGDTFVCTYDRDIDCE